MNKDETKIKVVLQIFIIVYMLTLSIFLPLLIHEMAGYSNLLHLEIFANVLGVIAIFLLSRDLWRA